MSTERQNEHDLDNLLKQVLKDDLPPETEFGMRKRLTAFRKAIEPSYDAHLARRAGPWKRSPVFELWFTRRQAFRKDVLVYVSVVMLAAGAVLHLGGYQSLLAESISLLKISMSLSGQIRRADSMDCRVKMPAAVTQATSYRIRWVREGLSRVDIESPRGIDETLWIVHGSVWTAGSAEGSSKPATYLVPSLPEPVMALLSPADLARRLDQHWQLQHDMKQHDPNRLVFIDRQSRDIVEVYFEKKSFVPISLSWKPPETNGKGRTGGAATRADFTWNQHVAPELMVPRLKSGR